MGVMDTVLMEEFLRGNYLVQAVQGNDDLCNVDLNLTFPEVLPLVQVGEQLAPTHIVCRHRDK